MKAVYRRMAPLLLAVIALPLSAQLSDSLYHSMKWRLVGPFRGGRVLAVAGLPNDRNTYYMGAAAGGVWKSTEAGLTWKPLFDHQSVSSIGALAVAPSDPNVIYVGTGEACIRGDSSYGNGVYKSTDAGKTWTNVGLADSRHIGRVLVDPHNSNIVYVAALGHAYGSNSQRGVFRSMDGGKSWQNVLYKDDKSGAIDLSMDAHNPRIIYAAFWQMMRTPWSLISGGPGSGLYKSTDGGNTWKQLQNGLPAGPLGRIGISVSPADSNRVYALIEAKEGGLFRSDNAGETWTKMNGDYNLRKRPWYFTHVFADPKSAGTVYVQSFGMYKSTDGGQKFAFVSAPYGDFHDLWIDPNDPGRIIVANDRGATISTDGGHSWSRQDNQPTAQFYHVIADNRFDYHLYGAQQDGGTVAIPTRTDHGAIQYGDWYSVGGGESGYIAPDPVDPNIVYAGDNYGLFTRFDKRTRETTVVSPWPRILLNVPAVEAKYRFGWTPPIQFSVNDPKTLYVAAQVLFESHDQGMHWTQISPDLTRNDKTKQQSSGGPITQDNTGVEYYDQITTVAESPVQKGTLWVGTDDGLIQITRDGGKTWNNVTPKQMPEWAMVSIVEASPHSATTAYVAVENHRLDDFRPHIFKTSDGGKTWTQIINGLPQDSYVHVIREDPRRKGLLYAGTETGMYISFDDGAHWQSLQMNLPTTPIYDVVVHNNDLAVATHGRSFWVLDDLAPLREASAQITDAAAHLYKPEVAYRVCCGEAYPEQGAGENPPNGAVIDYYLKLRPEEPITLEIVDSRGRLAQKFTSTAKDQPGNLPAAAGLNRFVWNLRYPGPASPSGAGVDQDPYANDGPVAVPGEFQVRLIDVGQTFTTPLEIRLDPRVKLPVADLQKQFELWIKIRDKLCQAREAVWAMRELRTQLSALENRLNDQPQAKAALASADVLYKKILQVEEGITGWKVEPGRYSLNYTQAPDDDLLWLMINVVESGDGAPNEPTVQVFEDIAGQIDSQISKWQEIADKEVPAFNDLMRRNNIPTISVPTSSSASHPAETE